MPAAIGYAYPWDFEGDEAAAGRAAELGVDAVAVAASYHATRAGRPLHPSDPLVHVEHAACYVPVRAAAWAGSRLVPRTPSWTATTDSFGAAQRRLAEVGLQTHAWVVLTHNSTLGRAHPDLAVRNAFGHTYRHALCPSSTEVADYCATLVEEVLLAGPVDGLVLEACGPMGFDHNGAHEKISLAGWTLAQRQLFSLCFCTACMLRYSAAGVDVPRLQDLVRKGIRSAAPSVEQALGADLAFVLREVRDAITAGLHARILESRASVSPGLRLTLHADPDPWSTGSFAPLGQRSVESFDALVASCFEPVEGGRALAALRQLSAGRAVLGGLVRPTQDWEGEGVLETRTTVLREAGMDEVHLYHLGLVGPSGWALLRKMNAAFRSSG